MNPIKINYIIDAGLALAFVVNCLTGLMKFQVFLKLLNMSYGTSNFRILSITHDWSGIILLILILVHLVLHWRWIASSKKSMFSAKG